MADIRRLMPAASDTAATHRTSRVREARAFVRDLAHRQGLAEGAPSHRQADTVEFTQTRELQSFARSLASQNEAVPEIVKLQRSIQDGSHGIDADGIAEKMLADRDFVSALRD